MDYLRKQEKNWWIHVIMMIGSLCCFLPILLALMVSLTDEQTLIQNGYSLLPEKLSMDAYKYLFADASGVIKGYGVTIFVSFVGTVTSLALTSLLGYAMARKENPCRNVLSWIVLVTMLFNGGLVPWYCVYSDLGFVDTIWALIIPSMLVDGFNVMIMRSFFLSCIPYSLYEAAYLDGAGDFRVFLTIVLPLAKPVIATVGFMTLLNYWNDWYRSMVFMLNSDVVSIQYLMTKVLKNIQALQASSEHLTPEMLAALGKMPSESIRMAMAVVGSFPMLCVFPFFRKYLTSGMTIGAVKG